jgi:uncharacterized membrane protein YcjF (UPF0283 family)
MKKKEKEKMKKEKEKMKMREMKKTTMTKNKTTTTKKKKEKGRVKSTVITGFTKKGKKRRSWVRILLNQNRLFFGALNS